MVMMSPVATCVGSTLLMSGVGARTRTVTSNEQVLLFAPSEARQVTVVVVLGGNRLPDGGVHVMVGLLEQASVAVGVKATVAPLGFSVSTMRLAGQLGTGAKVSRTVTVKLHVLVRPWLSRAVQLTVRVPRANRLPDAGTQVTVTGAAHVLLPVTL
jgi:hypothetical protein